MDQPTDPVASRPHMPGYGILAAGQGTGLLPWSWATERLAGSHDYWLATVSPDGHPHVMPVWGIWEDGAVWFSSADQSRKARNLAANPRCAVTTDNAFEPVVVEGEAGRVVDDEGLLRFTDRVNRKYKSDYSVDFFAANACFRVRPVRAFALTEGDFTGSPTRWTFTVPP